MTGLLVLAGFFLAGYVGDGLLAAGGWHCFSPKGRSQACRKVNLATHERGRLAAGSALQVMGIALPAGTCGRVFSRAGRSVSLSNCLARQGADVVCMSYEPEASD